ncbi:MAG TPA: FtsX-like permease family protein [Phycisphaerae bacterium]|nr:FtsX-like permease family protein [Phycisphaerae bacterium]
MARDPAAIAPRVRLTVWRAGAIALRSLRARAGRAALTLVTIAMAMAFLTNVWATRTLDAAAAMALADGSAAGAPAVGRTVWLLALSLLVCLVGISNAMLMSVMERFREIGTMKCLGAPDSFILKLFFLESLFLGTVGTAAGVLVGMGLSVLMLLRHYGPAAWGHIPWAAAAAIAAISLAIGIAITAAAAMYPAWRAARMEPIAAMRVDV